MPYALPPLPYAYDALEPHIDAKTMEIHHTKHHQSYIDKVNAALAGTAWEEKPIEDVIRNLQEVPENIRTVVRNHGGGHANHSFFWTILSPRSGKPAGEIGEAIGSTFGSVESFVEKFAAAALSQFGSGWAWLLLEKGGGLGVLSTPNQDSPLTSGHIPLIGLDIWEHAYYLKYQNRRADYVKAFWNVVNWEEVAQRFAKAKA